MTTTETPKPHPPIPMDNVKYILGNRHQFDWSLQGFGMLRLYLNDDTLRLHIWDGRYTEDNISRIHDHPWDFTSWILAGRLINQRYTDVTSSVQHHTMLGLATRYQKNTIKCGIGGHVIEEATGAFLYTSPPEFYSAGDCYSMRADELHDSFPQDGTISVIERSFVKEDRDTVHVYWPSGPWVSAEPRKATITEVDNICKRAYDLWF